MHCLHDRRSLVGAALYAAGEISGKVLWKWTISGLNSDARSATAR